MATSHRIRTLIAFGEIQISTSGQKFVCYNAGYYRCAGDRRIRLVTYHKSDPTIIEDITEHPEKYTIKTIDLDLGLLVKFPA